MTQESPKANEGDEGGPAPMQESSATQGGVGEEPSVKPDSKLAVKSTTTSEKKVPTCKHSDRNVYARGLCRLCYQRARLTGQFIEDVDRKKGKPRVRPICGHPERMNYARQMCHQCYVKRWRRKQDGWEEAPPRNNEGWGDAGYWSANQTAQMQMQQMMMSGQQPMMYTIQSYPSYVQQHMMMMQHQQQSMNPIMFVGPNQMYQNENGLQLPQLDSSAPSMPNMIGHSGNSSGAPSSARPGGVEGMWYCGPMMHPEGLQTQDPKLPGGAPMQAQQPGQQQGQQQGQKQPQQRSQQQAEESTAEPET